MEIFWLIWMLVLPVLGITMTCLFLLYVFVLMPPLARKITYKRFSNCIMLPIATDAGYVEFKFTKKGELPEGVVFTEKGLQFLPRPMWMTKKQRNTPKPQNIMDVETMALKKYIVKDFGKPILFGYAGKLGVFNPATLAALQQNKQTVNPEAQFHRIEEFIKEMPKHFRNPLAKMVKDLRLHTKAKPITYFDPAIIKQVLPRMIPPSLVGVYGKNRLALGMELKGKEYGKLILGGALILGLVIIAILVVVTLGK